MYAVINYKIDGAQVATAQYHIAAPYSYASCKLLVCEEELGEINALSCNVADYINVGHETRRVQRHTHTFKYLS